MEKVLKTLTLILLGIFLYSRLAGDTILFYINERFVTLTLLASAGLILVGASYFLNSQRHSHSHDGHEHEHDHDHGRASALGLLILAIPLVVGFLVPPRPLGANALDNRQINIGNLSSIAPPRSMDSRMGTVGGERNIVDWLAAFQEAGDPQSFDGQEARVIGFVYRDERFSEDRFMVGRFIVSCCVADAAPVGLIVQWPDAAELPADQWIEVSGRFQPGTFDKLDLPILMAEEVKRTEPPPQPYLYP